MPIRTLVVDDEEPARVRLRQLLSAIPEVEVIGHTDTVGSEADNDQLSVRRAEEVMTWLASQGFDRSQMSAVGRGERDLKVATGDNADNAANRRVEVIVR